MIRAVEEQVEKGGYRNIDVRATSAGDSIVEMGAMIAPARIAPHSVT